MAPGVTVKFGLYKGATGRIVRPSTGVSVNIFCPGGYQLCRFEETQGRAEIALVGVTTDNYFCCPTMKYGIYGPVQASGVAPEGVVRINIMRMVGAPLTEDATITIFDFLPGYEARDVVKPVQ
jgi:hypothetical protein